MIEFADPMLDPGEVVRTVNVRIRQGMEVAAATAAGPAPDSAAMEAGQKMAAAAAEPEQFNTRYASLKGWQEAVRKIRPIPRTPAQFSLTDIVTDAGCAGTGDAVDLLLGRFLSVPVDNGVRTMLVAVLEEQLGTADIARARSYMEEPLRLLAHLIMSTPEYQLA